jgi:hypothetical protein
MGKTTNRFFYEYPVILSVILGAITTMLSHGYSTVVGGKTFTIWIWTMYPLLLVASMFLGYKLKRRPWLYGIVMIYSSFFAALIVVPGAGNLFPFEFLFHTALAIPAVLTGLLGSATEKFSLRE